MLNDRLAKTLSEPFDGAQGERISTQFYQTTPFVVSLVEP